jgi:mono/diheme cytochrome c family protein
MRKFRITGERRGMKHRVWLLQMLVLFAAVLAAGPLSAADLAAAKQNYVTQCTECHGASGKGDGADATSLPVKPTDFTDCAKMKEVSDDTLFKVTRDGGPAADLNAAMPPLQNGALNDAEIKDVVAYIRSFCK